jgi:hypothetical protein
MTRVDMNGNGHPASLQVPTDLPRPEVAALVLQVHAAQGKLLEALAGPIPSREVLDELWMLLLQHTRSLTRILEEVLLEPPDSPE